MNIDGLKVARFYATVKHAGQLYGGDLPYTHHLAAVTQVMVRFMDDLKNGDPQLCGWEDDLLVACWLHDIVEDTGTKVKEVREMFGERVARLVEAVTDEPGENRKIRKALTYPKTRNEKYAVLVKLADRIANIEAGGSLGNMYKKEYEDFRRALYTKGTGDCMWAHLDKLMGWGQS
jgi:(p)ppGpp synthase/HD superfamily hydrolase